LVSALAALLSSVTFAVSEPTKEKDTTTDGETTNETATSLWERDTLTGDWGGLRSRLASIGIEFETTYTGEFLANVRGGEKTGELYQGVVRSDLNLDIEKAGGWKGGAFHVSGLWIAGSEPNYRNDIAGLTGVQYLEPSNISAYDTVRLYQLWLEQRFLDDRLTIRGGQLALDDWLLCSDYACVFIGGTHGWPAFLSALIPNGGPAYPVAGTGAMVTGRPCENIEVMGAVVDGDVGDQTSESRHGTHFAFGGDHGVLAVLEVKWQYNHDEHATGLPGEVKIGGWFDSDYFDDLRYDTQGVSLEDDGTLSGQASNGEPRSHHYNGGVYFNIDQKLWREMLDSDEGLGAYCRIAPWLPQDINPADLYVAGGLVYQGILPSRDQDVVGVAVAYVEISDRLRGLQSDANTIVEAGGIPTTLEYGPLPDYEMALEVTYKVVLAPWWTIQPDFQYIFHPGGSPALKDAIVLGVRTTISF